MWERKKKVVVMCLWDANTSDTLQGPGKASILHRTQGDPLFCLQDTFAKFLASWQQPLNYTSHLEEPLFIVTIEEDLGNL